MPEVESFARRRASATEKPYYFERGLHMLIKPKKCDIYCIWDGDNSSGPIYSLDCALMWIHAHFLSLSDIAYVEWGSYDNKGIFQPFCGCFIDDFMEEVYRA